MNLKHSAELLRKNIETTVLAFLRNRFISFYQFNRSNSLKTIVANVLTKSYLFFDDPDVFA
jgi:hypothetical protein